MERQDRRNKIFFGLGTVGRDMFYALEANALIYFLSNVLTLEKWVFAAVSMVLTVLRIFDALNDPITGLIIDNTHSRFGKFKPGILVGAVLSVLFYLMLFAKLPFTGWGYVIVFGLAYIGWDITYGINDIAYWSMMPALSLDQKQREDIGAFARICANVGMFAIMVGWQPITSALGNTQSAWFLVAVGVSVAMLAFQMFTIFGVRERGAFKEEEKTTLKEMFTVLLKNDQLMWVTVAMALFTVGYVTTTGFAIYYMQYIYGNADMYAILAAIVGVVQLIALSVFSLFSKKHTRGQLYGFSTILVLVGYLAFFFADHSLILIAVAAAVIFFGEAFIQLLMLMFIADTIEYGQLKLGKRNDAITFSIQPLINKIGGALSTGIISISLILSGIKVQDVAAEMIDDRGKLIVKVAMLAIPLIFIVAGYIVYKTKYRITAEYHKQIVAELKQKGLLKEEA